MGVRRYSRDPWLRRRQEVFDALQHRVGIDYYAPSIGELTAAGIRKARPICRDYACLHEGAAIDLTTLPSKKRTHTLRRQLVCVCGLRRPRLVLVWEGEAS